MRELRPLSLLAGIGLTARSAGDAARRQPRDALQRAQSALGAPRAAGPQPRDALQRAQPDVTVYTDGACSGNPGPGGWAAIINDGGDERVVSGSAPRTTNQRMELQAVAEGLAAVPGRRRVHVYSDSAYIVNCFREGWWERWEKNGWRNSQKQPVANRDLWERILAQTRRHDVEWHKVPGHADDVMNNRVDALARAAIAG